MCNPNKSVRPVVLAGGSGTRLWPLSRKHYPKQFVPFVDDQSLFEGTLRRLRVLAHEAPLVVCNDEHRFLVAETLRRSGIEGASILLEPIGRNTAPGVALAALEAMAEGEDPVLLVLPADHTIPDLSDFAEAVEHAASLAAAGHLMTFGVQPDRPETGYGYIRATAGEGVRTVEAFVEKPDRATAERYLSEGGYFWNSGMFVFRASTYVEQLSHHAPEILRGVQQAYAGRRGDLDFLRFDAGAFIATPGESIDYAVMERTDRAMVVPFTTEWSDVGSWHALWEHGQANGAADEHQNVLRGDVMADDVRRCYLHGEHRLIAAVGLEDCVVVETADAVLVAPRARAEDVKRVVERLEAEGRIEKDSHRRVYRPWGSYEGLDAGERFLVKRIIVDPGGQLSLQLHYHRAEHWIVVRGTARVVSGDRDFLLSENESTYIPLGTEHRLENPGHIRLELIEVQSGAYLGEDDIIRLSDNYGR